MTFNSVYFAVFFAGVFSLVAALRNRIKPRNVVLLAASYFFYGWWDWRFLSLLGFSTLLDYACGILMDQRPVRGRREKLILAVSLSLNLGLLGFFKYWDFFVHSAAALLTQLGLAPHLTTLNIILPVGISFYTFQTMSYAIDVYRRRLSAERSLLNFALYVSFFPQLVAGPIERADALLPQFRRPAIIDRRLIYSGCSLIGWGLFKKVVLADNAGLIVDAGMRVAHPGGGTVLVSVYAFAIQVYCDCSGYTDIARGCARCMGFELMRNFNLPYFATSPADFWRRWHISLSTWLRDYVYYPLGGNRRGQLRTYLNLMITFVLGGLWHGAAWTFVLWGAMHGALLCAHRAMEPWMSRYLSPSGPVLSRLWHAARIAIFFHLFCITLLLFISPSPGRFVQLLRTVLTSLQIDVALRSPARAMGFVLAAACLVIVQLLQYRSRRDGPGSGRGLLFHLPVPARAAVYAAGILAFIYLGEFGGESFIYFQF